MAASSGGDLGREVLEGQRRFDVVLLTGERWRCELVRWGENELLIATPNGRYLLPKHSIAYIVLNEDEESVGAEAEEVVAEAEAIVATDSSSVATVIGTDADEIPPPVP